MIMPILWLEKNCLKFDCVCVFFLCTVVSGVEYMTSHCGETLDIGGSSGTFDSQFGYNYNNNLDCAVTLRTNPGNRLLLTFERLSIEGTEHRCAGVDYLELFDGSSVTLASTLGPGQICGTTEPADVISTSSSVTLRFKTDSTVKGRGFSISYTSFSSEDEIFVSTINPLPWVTGVIVTVLGIILVVVVLLCMAAVMSCDAC